MTPNLANIDPSVTKVTLEPDHQELASKVGDGGGASVSQDSVSIEGTTTHLNLHNPSPPPKEVEFVLPQVMREVTVAMAAKIMKVAKKNARDLKRKLKEAEEADGDNLLAMKKKLKLAIEEKK